MRSLFLLRICDSFFSLFRVGSFFTFWLTCSCVISSSNVSFCKGCSNKSLTEGIVEASSSFGSSYSPWDLIWSAWANTQFPFYLFIIAVLWPFCMINCGLSGFDYLFFLYHNFPFVEYDIISGALICIFIKVDGLSSVGLTCNCLVDMLLSNL